MDNKIKKKSVGKIQIERNLEVIIVNGLDIKINCPIELIGSRLTIWINKTEQE